MNLDQALRAEIVKAVSVLFNHGIEQLQLQPTNKEFEGSHTLVCFPLTKISKKKPEETANAIGEYLVAHSGMVSRFNVVKGFLNLVISDSTWTEVFRTIYSQPDFGQGKVNGKEMMVEYSSPNTNKPLHLGHLRNNFLGYSVAEIYKANGYKVHKVQIINDRGIHICKSMAAWKLFGNGETPESSGTKGDHLVGKYYVEFDKNHKRQLSVLLKRIYAENDFSAFSPDETDKIKNHLMVMMNFKAIKKGHEESVYNVINSGEFGPSLEILVETKNDNNWNWKDVLRKFQEDDSIDNKRKKNLETIFELVLEDDRNIQEVGNDIVEIAQNRTSMMMFAQEMLRKWEAKDPDTVDLWKTMNGWVYSGFNATYQRMGVDFEKMYYESDTYLLGKEEVMRGVEKGVFFKKDDNSIWVDLTADGLDQKVLLRSDGTSVYMTQDIGTAILRFRDFPKIEGQIYTVGNEQDYHFKVLFLILKKLGYTWAEKCYHLSYGMVDLPTGKMKSREGTVVDADDLMEEMVSEANQQTLELGKVDKMDADEIKNLSEMIGLGALKFFLVKVDPKKRMLFDPGESIQLQGHTGPFIQYTHARIRAILRKAQSMGISPLESDLKNGISLEPAEREVLFLINNYPNKIVEAAREYSPAVIANFAYDLAKEYNQFYQSIPIFNESDPTKLKFRIAFSTVVADTIRKSMQLLGIQVPERM